MATVSKKTKKQSQKAPKGRPFSTSIISRPAVEDTTQVTALSSFSPDGYHFAFLSLAVDKHRLRIYHAETGQSISEHIVESARVSCLSWGTYEPLDRSGIDQDGTASPSKKKRKKRNSTAPADVPQPDAVQVVMLGLSDGTILLFSPIHGRVLQTLIHTTSTSAILSVVSVKDEEGSKIWTSGADGSVRLWDAGKNDVLGSWKNDNRIPYSRLAIQPRSSDEDVHLLAAHHSIRLLAADPSFTDLDGKSPQQVANFTGHASNVTELQWDSSSPNSNRFFSIAEADRFVYLWELPTGSTTEGKAIASIPLDSDARRIALCIPPTESMNKKSKQQLLALSATGAISIYPIPTEIATPASSKGTQHKLPTLTSRTNLSASSKNASATARIADASFASGEEGHVRIARVVGGIRPVFDNIRYIDDAGEFIPNVVIDDVPLNLPEESSLPAILNKRYAEKPSLAVGSGVDLGQDAEMDDIPSRDVDGDLDVDLAELSLGQRLTALSGGGIDGAPSSSGSGSEDSDEDDDGENKGSGEDAEDVSLPSGSSKKKKKRSTKKSKGSELPVVPANSLTRTLIQALHSSDSRLIEMCLAHSDTGLIRNTVRRLPPQLAVPLINACVERLGRGARAGTMKGGGAASSSQRGSGLVNWVKAVLAVHSGHLMTIPDLVARLSSLHATLTARLALHESLLSLSGKLDMVLSQIEMRSSVAPAPLVPKKGGDKANKSRKQVQRYVEGESDEGSEDEEDKMEVEVEAGSGDDGSIEDVELGGSGDESDEDDDDDEEDDDEEDEDDDEEPTMNGFIDDEADEASTDEEEDESE
ncbi:NUC189-domain-containing protein [Pluteus cervinus]|uniref:NUC189-domain-containing protein n=1 Tax=Pluteus cervinus TaxID=181527 RepID=A0ACD3BGG4_9AGAR|nr:NUC189-domain-containing protein [Pluteus cervinus]